MKQVKYPFHCSISFRVCDTTQRESILNCKLWPSFSKGHHSRIEIPFLIQNSFTKGVTHKEDKGDKYFQTE